MEDDSDNDGFAELDSTDVQALKQTFSNRVLDSKQKQNRARISQYRLGAKLIAKYGRKGRLPQGQKLRHDTVSFDCSHMPIMKDIEVEQYKREYELMLNLDYYHEALFNYIKTAHRLSRKKLHAMSMFGLRAITRKLDATVIRITGGGNDALDSWNNSLESKARLGQMLERVEDPESYAAYLKQKGKQAS